MFPITLSSWAKEWLHEVRQLRSRRTPCPPEAITGPARSSRSARVLRQSAANRKSATKSRFCTA